MRCPGLGAEIWTFVTYALIHGDWTHLGINCVWLLAFGTPVARRFGAIRYLAFFAVTSAAGAAAHLATHSNAFAPMVGASASISGFMAAAMRFAFQRSGPLGLLGRDDAAYRVPALPLGAVLRDPRVLAFLAVWFALNLLFGIGSLSLDGGDIILKRRRPAFGKRAYDVALRQDAGDTIVRPGNNDGPDAPLGQKLDRR